ncbi:MAG: hypothetical protein RIQ33_3 [Bacteroidota bacterium]|jgi:hypothetical protein
MKTNTSIQNELEQISAIVAEIAKQHVFKVPENYFNQMHEQILSKINVAEEDILMYSKSNPFNTPQGYFENLADVILLHITSSQTSEKEIDESKILNFITPDNYFENFSESILSKVKSATVEPTINANKINSFEVPYNYFENNETQILKIVKQTNQPTSKLILWFNKTSIKFTAAAAAAALIIGVALYFNIQHQDVSNQKLTAQEIKLYLQNNTEDVDDLQLTETPIIKTYPTKKEIKHVDTKQIEKNELKEYLENELDESAINDAI